jgi:hypothetical protein
MGRTLLKRVRAGDTDPLAITVGATGLTDLDDLSSAELYARLEGAEVNHVDGAACSVLVSADLTLTFDPVGNGPEGADAFSTGDEGTYFCYVKITWSDGDETRHPAAEEEMRLDVVENYEE